MEMASFHLPEELKPPAESDKYEKVTNPWAETGFGSQEYYYRKIPENRNDPRGENGTSISQKKRNRVLQRDNHLCRNCGSDSCLEVHHIVPRIVGGSHELDNLLTLCRECHRRVRHPHTHGETDCSATAIVRNPNCDQFNSFANECDNCEFEGEPVDEIEAHFVVPLLENGTLTKGNIAFLCSDCHSATHGKQSSARTDTILNIRSESVGFTKED